MSSCLEIRVKEGSRGNSRKYEIYMQLVSVGAVEYAQIKKWVRKMDYVQVAHCMLKSVEAIGS